VTQGLVPRARLSGGSMLLPLGSAVWEPHICNHCMLGSLEVSKNTRPSDSLGF
jgi:hypothetical protein